jgi:hypothetical protein
MSTQSETVKKMEAEGWSRVMTAASPASGPSIQMAKVIDGVAHHVLVLADGTTETPPIGQ